MTPKDQDSTTKTLYVRLLNEGVEVFRPTQAVPVGDGIYKLLPTPDYDPTDEEWEFTPGSTVKGILRILHGEVEEGLGEVVRLVAKEYVPK